MATVHSNNQEMHRSAKQLQNAPWTTIARVLTNAATLHVVPSVKNLSSQAVPMEDLSCSVYTCVTLLDALVIPRHSVHQIHATCAELSSQMKVVTKLTAPKVYGWYIIVNRRKLFGNSLLNVIVQVLQAWPCTVFCFTIVLPLLDMVEWTNQKHYFVFWLEIIKKIAIDIGVSLSKIP